MNARTVDVMGACALYSVEFEPSKPSQRFCASACRKRAHRQRQREASAGVVVELPTTEARLEQCVMRAARTACARRSQAPINAVT